MARIRSYGSLLDLTLFTLGRASTTELLTVVIETLRQHIEVWACMNVMKTIAESLYTAHQVWRTRGIRTRALLYFVIEVDNERYLEPVAREHVLADVSAYTHALYPINQHSDTVPSVLPEILLLATDPDPEAPSNLAKSLWYKYMTTPDWAWKVWDNTIASLRQIPVMISDVPGRRACALRYADFLSHVDQHLPNGFDNQVLEWFLGAGKNEVAALGADAWDVVTVVLLHLSVCGALTTTTILQGLVYPVWNLGARTSSFEQGQTLEILLVAVNDLFHHLLLKDECGNSIPPLNLFEAQGLQTRRRDVFREPHFSSLVDNLPQLVLIEQNSCLSEGLRRASLTLRQSICQVSVFRQGVYRDLDSVRLPIEKLLECRDIAEDMHESLVAALRTMLRDPGQGADAGSAGFEAVSSLLSPWKLAATSIEIRLTLKQLGEGLSRDSTRDAANATLDKVTAFVFHHCKTPEEADFVAEMTTEVSRDVAGKFVNAGLQRITDIFHEEYRPSKTEDMVHFVANMGEILRLLSKIVERFREDASLPQLIPAVQDKFISALDTRLMQVTEVLTVSIEDSPDEPHLHHASHCAIFLCRLLQFNLGFPGAWTPQAKLLSERICSMITRLALLHGTGSGLDLVAFPLLLDTLFYVVDDTSDDPKAPSFDPFRNYPELNLADLPPDMPPDFRKRLRSLLPYVSLNLAVSDLAYASRDCSGVLVNNTPVQNRPWEWTEYLGDVPAGETKGDDRAPDERHLVKNSASLSLELFGARMTGEYVIHSNAGGDPMVEGNIRTFQDDLSGESVFMRDWRETRVLVDDVLSQNKGDQEEDVGALPTFASHGQGVSERRSTSRRVSPALSVRSRASVHHSGPSSASSLRQSPGLQHPLSRMSASTTSEAIDVDSLDIPSSSIVKRKAGMANDDDEIEIVEGPVPSSRATKKPRTKASTKTRTKKR
ncbi:hypothetical protein AcV7_004122 [Taiwanofungus camphoratus]|nr:hypothetical protein AcV7_004122 [Antrodia cinnamomea]